MLVLKRRIGKIICIGKNIKITLVEVGSGWAKIGIDAPREIPVHRQEVQDLIDRKEKNE